MPKAVITVGIPASGKSTWADRAVVADGGGTIKISRDDIRFSLYGCKTWSDYKFSKEKEKFVTAVQRGMIEEAFRSGKNVIVADTNLNPQRRETLISWMKSLGFEVQVRDFPISLEEAYKRDAAREAGVGQEVIYKMYQQWLEYKGMEKYDYKREDNNKPLAYYFDLDGTLAIMNGRNPYDWDKVAGDILNEPVAEVAKALRWNGYHIIICSGRDSCCREETIRWLRKYHVNFDDLFMRRKGDSRRDSTVKEEIITQQIFPKYRIVGAFDDRPQVCRKLREMGINVFQVGDPYIEF